MSGLQKYRLMLKVAKSVSIVFHPLWTLTWAMVLLMFGSGLVSMPDSVMVVYGVKVVWMTMLYSALVPLAFILLLRGIGVIKSMEMKTRAERTLPYVVTVLMMGVTLAKLYGYQVPPNIILTLGGGFVALIILMVVNFFWKISAHACGLGALTAFVIYLSTVYGLGSVGMVSLLFVVSGVVATARMALKCHTLWQITVGYMLGFGMVLFSGFNSSQYLLLMN